MIIVWFVIFNVLIIWYILLILLFSFLIIVVYIGFLWYLLGVLLWYLFINELGVCKIVCMVWWDKCKKKGFLLWDFIKEIVFLVNWLVRYLFNIFFFNFIWYLFLLGR